MIYKHFVDMLEDIPPKRSHSEIKKEVFSGFEDFVGTKKQIEEEEARLNDLVKSESAKQQKAYIEHQNSVKEQFKQALFEEYGFGVDAINNKVWDLVSENSYYDIEWKFEEIIDLAEFAYRTGQMNHDK